MFCSPNKNDLLWVWMCLFKKRHPIFPKILFRGRNQIWKLLWCQTQELLNQEEKYYKMIILIKFLKFYTRRKFNQMSQDWIVGSSNSQFETLTKEIGNPSSIPTPFNYPKYFACYVWPRCSHCPQEKVFEVLLNTLLQTLCCIKNCQLA